MNSHPHHVIQVVLAVSTKRVEGGWRPPAKQCQEVNNIMDMLILRILIWRFYCLEISPPRMSFYFLNITDQRTAFELVISSNNDLFSCHAKFTMDSTSKLFHECSCWNNLTPVGLHEDAPSGYWVKFLK